MKSYIIYIFAALLAMSVFSCDSTQASDGEDTPAAESTEDGSSIAEESSEGGSVSKGAIKFGNIDALGLNGSIAEKVEEIYTFVGVEKYPLVKNKVVFDKNGYIKEINVLDPHSDDELIQTHKYEYSAKSVVRKSYAPDGFESEKIKYILNADGKVSKETVYYPDYGNGETAAWVCEYKYNSEGKLSSKTWLNSAKTVDSKYEYEYKNGKLSIEKKLGNIGNLKEKVVYKYDGDVLTSKEVYGGGLSLKERVLYKYDDKGNPKSEEKLSAGGDKLDLTVFNYTYK